MLKLWLVIVIFVILIITGAGIFINGWRTVYKNLEITRTLVKDNSPFTQKNLQSETRILILGDSTAAGVGANDPRETVAGRFGADFPGAYIINQGMPGRDWEELMTDFPRYPTKHLKLAIIMMGMNDVINLTWGDKIKRDTRQAVERAALMANNVLLIDTGNIKGPFFPKSISWLYAWRARQIGKIYERIAEEFGAVYVNIYDGDIARSYATDGLHPTGEGYKIWYEKIRAAMSAARISL